MTYYVPQTISWDIKSLAAGLQIRQKDARELFRDGRPASFMLKCKVSQDSGWASARREDGVDWLDHKSRKWALRVLTDKGVSFAPNKMLGTGRSFKRAGFLDRLGNIFAFIVGDVTQFPTVNLYEVKSDLVLDWHAAGLLSESGRLSVSRFRSLMADNKDV